MNTDGISKERSIHDYDDMIDMPHHRSVSRPHMSLYDRAAQFSPFAALTGHEASIRETARLTEEWVEPDEDEKIRLDEKLRILGEHMGENADVTIVCFVPDEKKSGGAYVSYSGKVKKMDMYQQKLILDCGTELPITQIRSIESKIFQEYEYII